MITALLTGIAASPWARAALRYGFEHLRLERIIGLVHRGNAASIRVIEKLGMVCTGVVTYRGEETLKYAICAKEPPSHGFQRTPRDWRL